MLNFFPFWLINLHIFHNILIFMHRRPAARSCIMFTGVKDNWLMPSVIYFRNPLSNCDSSEKVLKSFKEVGLAKSEKKLHPYFSEDPKCYIFSKSSQQMWLSEKVTKYFKEVNIAKSGKKLQPYITEDSKCYLFWNSLSNCGSS